MAEMISKAEALKAVDDEPELTVMNDREITGMRASVLAIKAMASLNDDEAIVDTLRLVVRLTKKGIRERISEIGLGHNVASRDAEAEGLREAVRVLRKAAVEIASMPTPDGRVADIPARAMLQLAQEISRAAIDAAGGA